LTVPCLNEFATKACSGENESSLQSHVVELIKPAKRSTPHLQLQASVDSKLVHLLTTCDNTKFLLLNDQFSKY